MRTAITEAHAVTVSDALLNILSFAPTTTPHLILLDHYLRRPTIGLLH